MAGRARPACVRFAEFVLDSGDERLIGPGGPVRIGNKAYRVLWALVGLDGRLLTKEELFETVWDGTVVSESALTSVIKELRRALGDDPKNPRFIESVYGRGYRFLAPVSEAEPAELAREGGPGAEASVGANPAEPGARRHGLPALATAGLLVAVLAIGGAWLALRDPGGSSVAVRVEPLQVAADDTAAQLLRQSMSTDLTRMVVGNDARLVFTDGADPGTASAQAEYAVTGEARSGTGRVHAALRLVNASGTILWSRDFEAASAEVSSLRRQMAVKVADVLVCALGSRSRRPRGVDLPTVRLFLAGCENFHTDWPEARRIFAQVVEQRPDFAQARAMYAATLYWNAGAVSDLVPREREALFAEAQAQAEQALALDAHVGSAYFVRAQRFDRRDQYAQRAEVLREGARADPASGEIRMSRCVSATNLGLIGEGHEECERALALDPFSVLNVANLAEGYAFGGRLAHAWPILDAAGEAWPGEFYTSRTRFEVTARLGDPAAALRTLDDPRGDRGFRPPNPDQWRLFLRGRTNPAEAPAAARAIAAASRGLPPEGRIAAVQHLVQLGDLDRAFAVALALPVAEDAGFVWFREFMAPMRADRRFAQLLVRQRFPVAWAALDRLPDFCAEPIRAWRCPASPAGWQNFRS
jgi:DNA-binding winged helix-turn-helix (wHTH) protein/TolB-like protein